MEDKITIHIDGQEVQTEPGKMVLEAAIDAGISVSYTHLTQPTNREV